ncbi:MAG TPA: proline--tRNA ligase [Thermoanaerobaculia bacterium]|nr:proline--tRNA ligase [Thermoanaerobaculia bacterium]
MRWSQYFLLTARESPADAEVVSHRLMVRAGMLAKLAAGIYTYQPAGWRSMRKLMAIIRRELDRIGSHELSMPAIQPAELWQQSGRWQAYGKELLRIRDRHEREFCFGPTHEEVITDLVRGDVKSYRQLPISLYQIQTKFRDEIRPRFGLMRGREFLMKDAYSFHATAESLDLTYRDMHAAYSRILEACGLEFIVVEADTGTIGGSSSHEFMVLAQTGESVVVHCPSCGYAANVEKATTTLETPRDSKIAEAEPGSAPREVPTPGLVTVAEVAEKLETRPDLMVKTLIYDAIEGERSELVAVAVRGDREINEVKLGNFLDAQVVVLASEERVREATGAPVGFAGPVGLAEGVRLIADPSVRGLGSFACGANRADAHLVGVEWGRDAEPEAWVDLLLVAGGDPCPSCQRSLESSRGIEVGHIFKLGTKYSQAMGCTFTDENGKDLPMVMGCYGFGVGRTIAAAIEQNHDEHGIVWPLPLAPFQVLVQALNPGDAAVREAADALDSELLAAGVEVLYDDRDERPGVKFNDGDLVGIPIRVTVGARSLADGVVELSRRASPKDKERVPIAEAVERVRDLLP